MRVCNQDGCSNPAQKKQFRCAACRNSMRRYGINVPQRLEMLAQQENKCLICESYIEFTGIRNDQSAACIDHCHATGKIRGILCGHCNSMLSHFDKRKVKLSKIQEYYN